MEFPPREAQTDLLLKSSDTAAARDDVLDWDNLIPVPPVRPGGRIQIRLKKARRDLPLPAEDPWAK
jgi:hypothetical protein